MRPSPLARLHCSALVALLLIVLDPQLSAQGAPPSFRMTEVLLRPAFQPSPSQIIEITNTGNTSADLGQLQLCMQQFVSVKLADLIVPPGGSVRVHVGDSGIDTATDLWLPVGVPNLSITAGSLMLSSWQPVPFPPALCLDPANIVDFMQWGAPNQNGATVAVQAGRWLQASQFLPTTDLDVSLALGTSGGLAGNWFRDVTPTLGGPNVTPSARTEFLFPACSPLALPPMMTSGTPALGNLDFTVDILHQVPFSPAIIYVGLGHQGTPIPSPFLCIFFVDQILTQISTTADAAGQISFPWPVPHQTSLIGIDLSLQTVFFDNLFPQQPFQLSSGLAISF